MTNINKARVLLYKPRNTQYRIVHHDVKIKAENGAWELGCMYVSRLTDDVILYIRPYKMFGIEKWEILK